MVVLDSYDGWNLAVGEELEEDQRTRRSFLRGRGKDDNPAIFGLQIAIQVFGSDDLRAQPARLIQAEDERISSEKRRFIKSVASLLTENQHAWSTDSGSTSKNLSSRSVHSTSEE
jgi:hypothetical protein